MTDESPQLVWRGKNLRTYGEIGAALCALETAEEGAEFMAAYFTVNVHAAQNVGYLAGYYDAATRQRIHELTGTAHPIFGRATPTAEEAFDAGRRLAGGR